MNGDLQCYGLTYGVFNPNWPSDASNQIFASDQPGVLNTVSAFGTPATMAVSDGWGTLCVLLGMRLYAALETTKGPVRGWHPCDDTSESGLGRPRIDWRERTLCWAPCLCANIETNPNQPLETYCWGMLGYGFQLTTILRAHFDNLCLVCKFGLRHDRRCFARAGSRRLHVGPTTHC